jgi:hypothetical protein
LSPSLPLADGSPLAILENAVSKCLSPPATRPFRKFFRSKMHMEMSSWRIVSFTERTRPYFRLNFSVWKLEFY